MPTLASSYLPFLRMAMGNRQDDRKGGIEKGLNFLSKFALGSRRARVLFLSPGFLSARIPGRSDLQQYLLVFRVHCFRQANAIRRVLFVSIRLQHRRLLSPRTGNVVCWNFVLEQSCEGDLSRIMNRCRNNGPRRDSAVGDRGVMRSKKYQRPDDWSSFRTFANFFARSGTD